jgi:hypothetical protein
MDDSFDREFYSSEWQRVLAVGPYGIQPYIRTSGAAAGLIWRLSAVAGALGRWAASGIATRPMPLTTAPRAQG